jgi:SAM-dependent methyltransferase
MRCLRQGAIWLMIATVNILHAWLCSSRRWTETVERHIVPWVLDESDLGSSVLEIGPGYGAVTNVLRTRVPQLTCVEIDRRLAQRLRRQRLGENVRVVCEDATAMSFPDSVFDSAVSFTMLHHLPSAALQDRLLAEVARVLRPGGLFAGTDSLDSRMFRMLHVFDTLTPVKPDTFSERLSAAGFEDIQVDVNPYAFRFRARKM